MELKPGDRIPEVTIAQELGVSRTPVRNALKQLENEGLVVIYPTVLYRSPHMTRDDPEFGDYADRSGFHGCTPCNLPW